MLRITIVSLSCLLAACVAESDSSTEQSSSTTFACGPETCSDGEYCETIRSDVPEFSTGYDSFRCVALPACRSTDPCMCLPAETCQYGTGTVGGACSTSGTQVTVTCDIGG